MKSNLGSFTSRVQIFLKVFPFLFQKTLWIVWLKDRKFVVNTIVDLTDENKLILIDCLRKTADNLEKDL